MLTMGQETDDVWERLPEGAISGFQRIPGIIEQGHGYVIIY